MNISDSNIVEQISFLIYNYKLNRHASESQLFNQKLYFLSLDQRQTDTDNIRSVPVLNQVVKYWPALVQL